MKLDDVKVGDKLSVPAKFRTELLTVTSVNKNYVTAGGMQFNKNTGWQKQSRRYTNIFLRRVTGVIRVDSNDKAN